MTVEPAIAGPGLRQVGHPDPSTPQMQLAKLLRHALRAQADTRRSGAPFVGPDQLPHIQLAGRFDLELVAAELIAAARTRVCLTDIREMVRGNPSHTQADQRIP
ncbi:hypothetical protein ACQP2U_43180 (plasmid) [Nocardia sp. CA-084685]|uniref:hypothetical protein n=1 Tax=Nocardia sp. CA-084685 TaxID=3239970 RepID=UPI003D97C0FF